MNMDILKGKATQLKGRMKQAWARFTGDAAGHVDGSYDRLIGRIQENAGHHRDTTIKRVRQKYEWK